MHTLSEALKRILNGLAMQYEGDYLSDDDKKANLQRVLTKIEQEKRLQPPPPPAVISPAPHTTLTTK
jgi:hypothetical protein